MNKVFLSLIMLIFLLSCNSKVNNLSVDAGKELDYCSKQIRKSLSNIDDTTKVPRNILPGQSDWNLVPVSIEEWTAGFWPGVLWYNYEHEQTDESLEAARYYTELLEPLTKLPAYDHDLGFQIFCSYGNGYH